MGSNVLPTGRGGRSKTYLGGGIPLGHTLGSSVIPRGERKVEEIRKAVGVVRALNDLPHTWSALAKKALQWLARGRSHYRTNKANAPMVKKDKQGLARGKSHCESNETITR